MTNLTQTSFETSELSAILEDLSRAPVVPVVVPIGAGATPGRFEVLRELGRGSTT